MKYYYSIMNDKNKRILHLTLKSLYLIMLLPSVFLFLFVNVELAGFYFGRFLLFGTIFFVLWKMSGGKNFFLIPYKQKI